MESFSIWHWLALLVYLGIVMVPCWRVVGKAGYAGAWSLLVLVPLVNIIALWVFAFSRWPREKSAQ